MRVSLKWLRELVEVDLTVEALVDRLDMTGTAVESVEATGSELDGVVVGQIVTKDRHPDADKLWVTTVDVGAEESLTIVCGAQNFEAGDKVPVALVGATLPNGMTIKKAKLRGVTSMGMNCSAAELGLGTDHDGLFILPNDALVGMAFAEYRGSADTIIDLEITPNRPDCLSMAGVAREVAAVTDGTYEHPGGVPEEAGPPISDQVLIEIEDPDLCPRYAARLIRNVKIGPSPEWLVERIVAAGARPVSNVVDITNYVMFELGQPLHAFDERTLGETDGRRHIIVRRAKSGEKLRTLDGQDRSLADDMLLICDPSGPIALGGVMGGEDTEISEGTVDILLEAASFDTTSVSRTSRSLGLISEASMRFERGVDPNACIAALDRAAQLMADLCSGDVAQGVVDVCPRPAEPRELQLRTERLNEVLGTTLDGETIERILRALGFEPAVTGGGFNVTVPTFRPDVEREIDLIEEVVRVWGMDRVEATLPGGRKRVGRLTEDQRWRERIGRTMRAAGLNETITYAFVDPGDTDSLGYRPTEGELPVEVLNPMSEEQSVMRQMLLPGLLRSVGYNQRRGTADVHLYEMGTVFATSDGRQLPKERLSLAGVLAGSWSRPGWNEPAVPLDLFDGKGVLETLMLDMGIERWSVREAEVPWLQPGRSAEVLVRGDVIGWLGEVHPRVLDAFDTSPPVTAFEIRVRPLERAAVWVKEAHDTPRYPAIELDVALVVDEGVTAERVEKAIYSAGAKLLESARLFDVYRGAGVPEGKKSLAFSLAYRSADRTLTDDEVAPQHERLIRKVTGAVGAELRG